MSSFQVGWNSSLGRINDKSGVWEIVLVVENQREFENNSKYRAGCRKSRIDDKLDMKEKYYQHLSSGLKTLSPS